MGLLHDLIWNTYKSGESGGDSDFSTAEVRISKYELASPNTVDITVPTIVEAGEDFSVDLVAAVSRTITLPEIIPVVTYKGHAFVSILGHVAAVTEGYVIDTDNGGVIINGDGNISIGRN